MKLKLALLALIAGTSMIAQAQTANGVPKASAEVKAEAKAAVKTREDCSKEAIAALKAGDLECGEKPAAVKSKSTKARTAVKAETKEAMKAGEVATGEKPVVAKSKSTKVRADVKAEGKAAAKAGAIEAGEAPKK